MVGLTERGQEFSHAWSTDDTATGQAATDC